MICSYLITFNFWSRSHHFNPIDVNNEVSQSVPLQLSQDVEVTTHGLCIKTLIRTICDISITLFYDMTQEVWSSN